MVENYFFVMRIVHYTLGLAPMRSGGLTKYASDLMLEQAKRHSVVLLSASRWSVFYKNISFKRASDWGDIRHYNIKNSLPIPLLYGVKDPRDFHSGYKITAEALEGFYQEVRPDALHVHTLMGLPKELLEFLKAKGVKLVFTTHDYFGICPKVNLINQDGEVCEGPSEDRCRICNEKAKPALFLRLRNSRYILGLKNNKGLRKIIGL